MLEICVVANELHCFGLFLDVDVVFPLEINFLFFIHIFFLSYSFLLLSSTLHSSRKTVRVKNSTEHRTERLQGGNTKERAETEKNTTQKRRKEPTNEYQKFSAMMTINDIQIIYTK